MLKVLIGSIFLCISVLSSFSVVSADGGVHDFKDTKSEGFIEVLKDWSTNSDTLTPRV